MKNSIINSIKSLPPLSQTIVNINAVYANQDSSIQDMARAVENDPMVIANLLKAANSPLYGFAKEINSAAQAVSLFGMNVTRSIALAGAIRKLLKVDMQPYDISPDKFAEISEMQANLMMRWYKQIDKKKAEKLYLAAFLQETGKILIASHIIQEDETVLFSSEIELTNHVAKVEKSFAEVTSSEVTAKVFEHWEFNREFIEMIQYADFPKNAPKDIREFAMALHIVKAIVPVNRPLDETSINIGLNKAEEAGYNVDLLETAVDEILDELEK